MKILLPWYNILLPRATWPMVLLSLDIGILITNIRWRWESIFFTMRIYTPLCSLSNHRVDLLRRHACGRSSSHSPMNKPATVYAALASPVLCVCVCGGVVSLVVMEVVVCTWVTRTEDNMSIRTTRRDRMETIDEDRREKDTDWLDCVGVCTTDWWVSARKT